MKTSNLTITSIVFFCLIISCSTDSEDQVELGLVGTWVEISRTTSNCSPSTQNGTTTCTNTCQTFTFTQTTVTWSSPNDSPLSGIYSATNTMINITMDSGSTWSPMTYKVESNKLTLIYQDGTCTATEVYNRL